MSRPGGKQVKFLLTRMLTAAGATAVFVSLWASVAATARFDEQVDEGEAETREEQPQEQDGWRWDKATGQWVAIEQPAAPGADAAALRAPEQVVVVERQPVYYYVTYVYEAAPVGATPNGAAAGTGSGAAASSPATAPAPNADSPSLPPPAPAGTGASSRDEPQGPPPPAATAPPLAPVAPAAPAVPAAPVGPVATPPPAATAPPPPKPATPPATAKKTKGS